MAAPTTAVATEPEPTVGAGTEAAVEVTGLTFRYPGATTDSLRGVDLRIEAGDFVAVVGGNGSGKTTLCKAFNGLVPHFWNGDLSGSVRVFGRDTAGLTVADLADDVGYVFQDFGNQLVRPTVRDDVAFAPLNLGRADWEERTDAALDVLGLRPIADRYTWQLSGGQQHLVALAGSMALAPRLLVVDEPAAEVDPQRATAIYEHLSRLNAAGVTVVVVEHHADLIARYARSVVLMADGRPRWHLPVGDALARTEDLAAADIPAPQVVALARALDPTVRAGATPPLTVEACTAMLSAFARRPAPAGDGRRPGPRPDAPVIAQVSGVTHGYRSITGPRSTVLDGLDLTLRDGERVALVGSNGAGKSTLLSLLCGIALPQQGTVTVDGRDTRTTTAAVLADTVCHLVQRPEEMFLQDSIRGDVAMHPRGRDVPDAEALVDEVLERVRLADLAGRDGRLLSGGQQRRAALAVALAMRPRLLLLDEPTSSLDLRSRDDVIDMLAALAGHIRCTVVATHDMHLVAEWADRVVVLHQGRVLADTDPATLFASPDVLTAARLVPPQVSQVGAALGIAPVPLTVDALVGHLAPREVSP